MARIRSIHPDFPSDKKLAQVSRDVRLTYVSCWCIADDKGLFRAEPRQLQGALFPYDDDVAEAQLEAWLAALVRLGVVRWRQTRDGMRVGELVNFPKRQKIDRPSISFLNSELLPLAEGSRGPGEAGPNGSREASEALAAGVLSLESRVLSPEPRVEAQRARGSRESQLQQLLPSKAHAALDGYLRSARHPEAVVAAILDEGPDTGINAAAGKTWAVIGQALCDLQAAGEPFKPVLFRAYCTRLMRVDASAPDGQKPADRMRQAAEVARQQETAK